MADHFLLSHIVRPFLFEIGGKLHPVSIRGQMIRARVIVDRAFEAGLINKKRDLLVIGGGAAGLTAAIRACELGIKTVVIDLVKGLFSRQAKCTTRWVDPVQYDWPVSHWDRRIYPWVAPDMPLKWGAATANLIALQWQQGYSNALANHPNLLIVKDNTRLEMLSLIVVPPIARQNETYLLEAHLVESYDSEDQRESFDLYGMALSCIGFGEERCWVEKSYSGFKFWEPDPFALQGMRPPNKNYPVEPNVLISGAGDGALQDFLRVVTKFKSAREFYKGLSVPPDIERELYSAEDQAQRAYTWGANEIHDHHVLTNLHRMYRQAVKRLWNQQEEAIREVISPNIRTDVDQVSMVYPCNHFSRCYGLNHFLVLLVDLYLKEDRNIFGESPHKIKVSLYEGNKLDLVQSANPWHPACANDPWGCHGREHDVQFSPSKCPVPNLSVPASNPGTSYNVVIVRHGIQPPKLLFGQAPISNPRQMLPYHITH